MIYMNAIGTIQYISLKHISEMDYSSINRLILYHIKLKHHMK